MAQPVHPTFLFRLKWKLITFAVRARTLAVRYSRPRLSRTRHGFALVNHAYRPPIPQAGVIENGLESYRERNWRRYFSRKLSGHGLEIGPLHRPIPRHDRMTVDYFDRYTLEQLRESYPELWEYPIVAPTIIGDAATLADVPDGKYDFLVAAHVIEHMPNPLSAVEQWIRVLRDGGLLYLIVPDKRNTFDRHRVRTTVAHMVRDYLRPSSERDFEHFLDYAIHVNRAPLDGAVAEAERLVTTDYSIHFHVFIPSDIVELLGWFGRHVTPVEIAAGPCMSPGSDEFHLLVRKGEQVRERGK